MKVAKVRGTVVSSVHHRSFDGKTLLLCDLLDVDGQSGDAYTLAVDTVGAGVGQTVLILDEGSSARQVLGDGEAPIRAVVVGIVDQWTVEGGVRPGVASLGT